MQLFYIDHYETHFVRGYEACLLEKISLVLEHAHGTAVRQAWIPCIRTQWGGDHIYQWSLSWFRRSIEFRIWKLY